jgi:hypothetical protein
VAAAPAPPKNEIGLQNADAPALLRKQAEEQANSGRCDEAVKTYQQLERQYPRYAIAPRDRLPYIRCLRATGREQEAQTELEAQTPNSATPAPVAEPRLRRAASKAKKGKKAAPSADSALEPAPAY